MALSVSKVDMWAAEISDQPGALVEQLDRLTKAKVDLEFLNSRRRPDKPGTGVVFVTGVKGPKAIKAAKAAGFSKTNSLSALRVEGPNKPGACQIILQVAATAGINLRGVSASKLGRKFVAILAVDSAGDADNLLKHLKPAKRK